MSGRGPACPFCEATDARDCDHQGLWDDLHALEKELARLQAVYLVAKEWDSLGALKVMHILTCKECERLECAAASWCVKATEIGRRQLEAGKRLHAALMNSGSLAEGRNA